MSKMYPNLFKPMQIGKLTVKNRIAMGPMGGAGQVGKDGEFNQRSIDYYAERAKGGTGLIFTGVAQTDLEIDTVGGVNPNKNPAVFLNTGAVLTERVHTYGCKIIMQLSMGVGRNGALTGPSENPLFWNPQVKTRELTIEEIKKKIKYVVQGAVIAKNAGFDGVEVHAMHEGYLIDQFAMSYMNRRTDEYGGSLENRLRPATEIVQGIKAACGQDFPVTIRLGLKTYIKGFNQPSLRGEGEAGRTLEEGVEIAKALEAAGYDAISVDSGIYDSFYYVHPPMYQPKGFNLDLAAQAKKVVNIPILTAGRMDEPDICEEAIASGKTDGIVMARALLADPEFANKARMGKPEKIRPCLSCHQGCAGRIFTGKELCCAVNPACMRENEYGLTKTLCAKKILVIGGGVAGMEAARVAKIRGHEVSIYEKSNKLGGNLIPGGTPDFKVDDHRLVEWYENELKDLFIPVYLNTEVTKEMIEKSGADTIIIATGSSPIMPKIEGINHKKAMSCTDALLSKKEVGDNVVVVGGGLVGCELALDLANKGKKVTIVEAMPNILSAGKPVPMMNAMMLKDCLAEKAISILTDTKILSITDEGAVVDKQGEKISIDADSVILSIGFRSEKSLYESLLESELDVYEIGDGRSVANIMSAVWDAYEVARSI